MTVRSAHTRSAHTGSGRSSLRRQLRLTLLVAGIAVGASACELSLGSEPTPAAAPANDAATAATPGAGTPSTPADAVPLGSAPVGSGLPSDADRGGALPPVAPAGGAVDATTVPPAPASVPTQPSGTAPTATLPPTTLPPTTLPATTTAPTTTAPTTTAPTTTAPTTTAPTTTAPTTQPPTTQPPLTLPPYTVPPLSFTTYRVDVSAMTLSLASDCLPTGRSSLAVTGERYVTGHTIEPFSIAVGTSAATIGTASSMTADTIGQGFAGYTTWTVEGFQQRESDFAIARVGSTEVRDHRSITSTDGTRTCRADVVYTVTVTAV